MGKFIQRSSVTLAGQVAALVLGTAASVIISRVLGPAGKGIFTICTLLPFLIVTVCNLGVVPASAYYLARRRHSPAEVFGNNIVLAAVLGLAGATLGAVSVLLFRTNLFADIPVVYLYACLVLVPLNLIFLFIQSVPLGCRRFGEYNRAAVLRLACFLAGAVVFVWALKLGVAGAIAAAAVSYLAAVLLLFHRTKAVAGDPVWRISVSYLRNLSRFGLQSHVGNFISFLNYRGDMLLVNWLLGPAALGFYSVGVLLAEQIWLLPNAAKLVLFVRVAAEREDRERAAFTPRVFRVMLLVTVPAAAVFWLAAGPLVKVLFSSRFLPAVQVLRVLIPGTAAMGISGILANDIAGRGKPLLNSGVAAGMLALNLALNWIWIPRLGIAGAALASTVSYSATLFARLILYCRLSGNSWPEVLLPRAEDLSLLLRSIREPGFRSPAAGAKEEVL